jgi:hypothetical protein
MKGPVPAVDVPDLKKAWQLRREHASGSIDVVLYQRVCKPNADAFAVGYRASLLVVLAQMGQEISEDFLAAFAKTPLDYERCTVQFPLH